MKDILTSSFQAPTLSTRMDLTGNDLHPDVPEATPRNVIKTARPYALATLFPDS